MVLTGGTQRPLARVIAFVDGGYLRENFKQKFNIDFSNYSALKDEFRVSKRAQTLSIRIHKKKQ